MTAWGRQNCEDAPLEGLLANNAYQKLVGVQETARNVWMGMLHISNGRYSLREAVLCGVGWKDASSQLRRAAANHSSTAWVECGPLMPEMGPYFQKWTLIRD
jgi:hypothetical protein